MTRTFPAMTLNGRETLNPALAPARQLRAIAEAYGAIFVNFWPQGKNSWPYWNSLGYWGDDAFDGLAGADKVHPSDGGYGFMESVLYPLLTET